MANVKITGLTQATNADLTDGSLAYVVTDPSGTPASANSTLARIGTLRASFLDAFIEVLGGAGSVSAPSAGAVTTGMFFNPSRNGQSCTGARFYWSGVTARTLKLTVWEDPLTYQTKNTTVTVPGYYEVPFLTPLSMSRNKVYAIGCYEISGTEYMTGQNTNAVGTSFPLITPQYQPEKFRDYNLVTWAYYRSGDAIMDTSSATYLYPIEPMVSG